MKNEPGWKELISLRNLWLAFQQAAKGRRGSSSVASFEFDLERNLLELQAELVNGRYQPGKYIHFTIHDPKRRLISAAPFRDRVVHHALCNIIEPRMERKYIYDSYANRPGKGNHRAVERCTAFLRRFEYVMPMDIVQFFPSIDHEILLEKLSRVIPEQEIQHLCALILRSADDFPSETTPVVFFPGDDLLAALRPRGLPIGNLTSQLWANYYLDGLDQYIKRDLKCRGYIRYVDDLLLFSNSKKALRVWREEIIHFLQKLRLVLHENSAQPHPCQCGVPFLGFQVFPGHRRLKRHKVVYARRHLKETARWYNLGRIDLPQARAVVQSWISHASHADTWGLREDVLSRCIFSKQGG